MIINEEFMTEFFKSLSLNVKQFEITLLIPTLPTINIPKSPSPTASACINLASKSLSFVLYLIIAIISPLHFM